MSRNTLYLVIGLLIAAVLVAGFLYYQERNSGLRIEVGEHGIQVDGN